MYKTYILGNGGFAQEVFEQIILTKQSDNFGGFIIIKQEKAHSISEDGVRIFKYPENCSFILGTSNAAWREMFIEHFTNHYPLNINHFPNVSANNCHISQTSRIGVGNVFLSFSLLSQSALQLPTSLHPASSGRTVPKSVFSITATSIDKLGHLLNESLSNLWKLRSVNSSFIDSLQ